MEIFMLMLIAVLYLLPTLVAVLGQNPLLIMVAPINILLGWTVFGWFLAMTLAIWPDRLKKLGEHRSC